MKADKKEKGMAKVPMKKSKPMKKEDMKKKMGKKGN